MKSKARKDYEKKISRVREATNELVMKGNINTEIDELRDLDLLEEYSLMDVYTNTLTIEKVFRKNNDIEIADLLVKATDIMKEEIERLLVEQ